MHQLTMPLHGSFKHVTAKTGYRCALGSAPAILASTPLRHSLHRVSDLAVQIKDVLPLARRCLQMYSLCSVVNSIEDEFPLVHVMCTPDTFVSLAMSIFYFVHPTAKKLLRYCRKQRLSTVKATVTICTNIFSR